MSRLEFMKELARLLDDLPREEKIEILKYYNGYFDDAGEENEADIIRRLGSPAKVAAEVREGMGDTLNEQRAEPHRKKAGNGWKTIVVLAVLCITFPVWIGLLGGMIGLLGGAIALSVGLVMALIGGMIALVLAMAGCLAAGITMMPISPVSGMLCLAVGIFLMGLILLLGLLIGLIFGKLIPLVVDGIANLVRWLTKKIRGCVGSVRR